MVIRGNILLIDDAENWYQTVKFVLEEEGYSVAWAKDKMDAQGQLAGSSHFDLVMVNLNNGENQ